MGRPFVIWWIGTTRRLDVENDPRLFLPAVALPYLEFPLDTWSYIYGDFKVCPIQPDVPGHMRAVCVSEARNLVAQRVRGSRPPVHLWSTWSFENEYNGPPEKGVANVSCDSTWKDVGNAKIELDAGTTELHDGQGEVRVENVPGNPIEFAISLKRAEWWGRNNRFFLVVVTADHMLGSGAQDSVFVYQCRRRRMVQVFWAKKEYGADVETIPNGFTVQSGAWREGHANCCPSFTRTERFLWSEADDRFVRAGNRITPRSQS